MESVLYKNLNSKARATYRNVVAALRDMKREVPLEGIDNHEQVLTDITASYPELFYAPMEWKFKTGLFGKTLIIVPPYSRNQITRIEKELKETASKIISENINGHQGEFDKAVALHDFLKSNIQYDHEGAAAPLHAAASGRFYESHNVVGALLRKKCVCEGFAKAFKYLCDMTGLECYCISGTGNSVYERGPHMWNIVRINGYYHHVDVTWDNQFNDDTSIPNYCYFCLDDKTIARDHTWDKRNYVKCDDAPYNYFKMNNSIMSSRVQLERFLKNCFEMEDMHILFKVDLDSKLAMEVPGCLNDAVNSASAQSRNISVNSWEAQFFEEQKVYCITPNYSFT